MIQKVGAMHEPKEYKSEERGYEACTDETACPRTVFDHQPQPDGNRHRHEIVLHEHGDREQNGRGDVIGRVTQYEQQRRARDGRGAHAG